MLTFHDDSLLRKASRIKLLSYRIFLFQSKIIFYFFTSINLAHLTEVFSNICDQNLFSDKQTTNKILRYECITKRAVSVCETFFNYVRNFILPELIAWLIAWTFAWHVYFTWKCTCGNATVNRHKFFLNQYSFVQNWFFFVEHSCYLSRCCSYFFYKCHRQLDIVILFLSLKITIDCIFGVSFVYVF